MEKNIVWHKWIDPFAEVAPATEDNDNDDSNEWKDSYEKFEDMVGKSMEGQKQPRNYQGPLMIGPMGIIPMNENNYPSKVYNFWMGHTNFNICPRTALQLEAIPGVEALDVFTRYRFRIAIGRAFNEKAVMRDIEGVLCPKDIVKRERGNIKPSKDKIEILKKHLTNKFPYWIILKLPNGALDTKGGASKEELMALNGNIVATSWE